MNKITFDYASLLAPDESKKFWLNVTHSLNYPEGVHDNTLLNNYGAIVISKLSAKDLAKLHMPLAK